MAVVILDHSGLLSPRVAIHSTTEHLHAAGQAAQGSAAAGQQLDAAALARSQAEEEGLSRHLRHAVHLHLDYLARVDGNKVGNTGEAPQQTEQLWQLARKYKPHAQLLCEIGLNVGHSAATLLTATHAQEFLAWDWNDKKLASVDQGFAYLREVFPEVPMQLHGGDSLQAVPAFLQQHQDVVCDVVHIDGSHDGVYPEGDFQNMRKAARKDGRTLVIFDDCGCSTGWCITPKNTAEKAFKEGTLIRLERNDSYILVEGRGSCLGWMQPA
jgi:hypothetical protein